MNNHEQTTFDGLWDYGDPAVTEEKFNEILPGIKASGNESHYIQLLTQIARTYSLRRKFEDAHKLLDDVEPLLKPEFPRASVRYHLERGRTFNSSNAFDKAREHFLKALDMAVQAKEDNLAVDAAHMLGIVEKGDASLEWNLRAIRMAEESDDEDARSWLGSLYNNLGWTYFSMKEYEKALDHFRKDIVWFDSKGRVTNANIARWSAAKTLRMMGRTDEALETQLALKEIIERTKDEDGYVYEELAECYLSKGNEAEGKKYAGIAYDILRNDAWLQADEPERLARLKELGGRD